MERESSKISGTFETPLLLSATHKYCLMMVMNFSLDLKTGPATCRMDNRR